MAQHWPVYGNEKAKHMKQTEIKKKNMIALTVCLFGFLFDIA